jgi:alkylation response protein AidB-like acyl-CoA dehydrogenase
LIGQLVFHAVPATDLETYAAEARAWLEQHAEPKAAPTDDDLAWGVGSDDVSVFHALTFEEEQEHLHRLMKWQQQKVDAGYGAISWPQELGGAGLTSAHERAFRREEAAFETPPGHETFSVTVGLIAPTVRVFGTPEQQERFVRSFLRTDVLCCQLFSEPGAGSDLASLSTRAERDGDEWVLNGQKVWSSGAQFSAWGEIITRTDPDVPKHKGMTAFLVPMDAPGVEVRPIKQMSGGSSFNEVFLTDVRIPDSLRLGDVGDGWKVALTTLGFERGSSSGGGSGGGGVGGSWRQVLALTRWLGATDDPRTRQQLATLYTRSRIQQLLAMRVAAGTRAGETPGPEGSIGKLLWTQGMTYTSDVVSSLLGPRLVADTGEWGTYAWGAHVLGAPGYRIAGGSDEVQRNIIGERVLGLPGEPRVDRDLPFRDIPR